MKRKLEKSRIIRYNIRAHTHLINRSFTYARANHAANRKKKAAERDTVKGRMNSSKTARSSNYKHSIFLVHARMINCF